MIVFCDLKGGGALDSLNLETASGVRTYSVRKPWRMSSSRYFQMLWQWMILCPLSSQ